MAQNKIYPPRFNCVLKEKYSHNDCEYNEAIMGSRNPTLTTKHQSTEQPTASSSNMKIRPDRELLLCVHTQSCNLLLILLILRIGTGLHKSTASLNKTS